MKSVKGCIRERVKECIRVCKLDSIQKKKGKKERMKRGKD
jgi:hypothetical protein